MARYRRPSTCRYCYETGHTQRTCPKVKEDAANGKSWAKQLIESNKQSVASRACSYCGEQKHTLRTCPVKINDSAVYEKLCFEYRKFVDDDLKKFGYQIGSLVKIKPYRHTDAGLGPVVCYVEKIVFDDCIPSTNWIVKHKLNDYVGPQTAETLRAQEEVQQYQRFFTKKFPTRRRNRSYPAKAYCTVYFRSVTNTGLGYWGDQETDYASPDDFLHHYSNSRNRSRYEVLS